MRSLLATLLLLVGLAFLWLLPAAEAHTSGYALISSLGTSAQEPAETPTATPTPTPTPDAELEEANRQTKLAEAKKAKFQADKEAAEARKAESEADKAAIEAKLAADKLRLGIGATTPAATAPSGNISGDKDKFIETQLLSEMSARKASQQLFQELCSSTNPALQSQSINFLVINSGADKSAAENYAAILAQLNFLLEHYGKLIGQAEDAQKLPEESPEVQTESTLPLIIPAATEAVKSVADLLNMFRTETEFKDQAVTVDTRMIVTFLVNSLLTTKKGPCTVTEIYYPSLYPLGIARNASAGPLITVYRSLLDDIAKGEATVAANNKMASELSEKVKGLDEKVAALKKKIAEQEKTKEPTKKKLNGKKHPPPFDVAAAKKEINKAEADKTTIRLKIERLKQTAANLEAFKTSLADLLKILTAVDSATNTTLLAALLRSERLKEILSKDHTYALDLAVKASGTNRIRKNAFFNAKVAHSAGVSVGANLFNNLDQLVFGQLEEYYVEFTNSAEIRKRVGFKKLDPTFAK